MEVCTVVFWNIQVLLGLGAELKAGETVITLPTTLTTVRVSTVDVLLSIADKVGVLVAVMPSALSTVITVVVADTTRPPRLTPARTGSLISMTWPGLTITPASIDAVNATISVSYFEEYRSHSPMRRACPLDVHAKASSSVLIIPYLAMLVMSSVTS